MIQSVLINAPRLLEEMYYFPATIYSPMSSVSEVTLKVVIGSFTVAIFRLIFGFIFGSFLVFGGEMSKMKSKMTQKWPKKFYCEQP